MVCDRLNAAAADFRTNSFLQKPGELASVPARVFKIPADKPPKNGRFTQRRHHVPFLYGLDP
jgi:hypothetical protein